MDKHKSKYLAKIPFEAQLSFSCFNQLDAHDMLNNKLIKRVVTAENEGQEFVWLGKKQAESNRSIGLHFCCTVVG